MTRVITSVLMLCAFVLGQSSAPIPDDQIPQRHDIFKNNKVEVSLMALQPGDKTPMHVHNHDMISVFVNGAELQDSILDQKPAKIKLQVGEVRFRHAGLTHSAMNAGSSPISVVVVEFPDLQGQMKKIEKKSRTCNPDSKVCLEEKELFCTEKVCVEDVVMEPHSVSVKHSHPTDHMLVAVSDYELTDEVESKGTVVRKHKSGEVEFIPAGITHQLTNSGNEPAHFTVIIWK